MSTPATIEFQWADGRAAAVIFRQCDGYPSGLGADLERFFDAVQDQAPSDTRFQDPSYLAAKWVVFDALAHAKDGLDAPLNFLSVGVTVDGPDGFGGQWEYEVRCHGRVGDDGRYERPDVACQER